MSWVNGVWPVKKHKVSYRQYPSQAVEETIACRACSVSQALEAFTQQWLVCVHCGHHHVMSARQRLALLTQSAPFQEIGGALEPQDRLSFCDTQPYGQRLLSAQNKTGLSESVVSGVGSIDGIGVVLSVFDFGFIGGSLGEIAGSRVVLAIQTAIQKQLPFVCVTASGGARMQEGVLSLFQMAKMSAAVNQLRQTTLPFITVLTHPTFGGVSASIAMQGDIVIAEKGAHIGFTGARVIEGAMGQKLPEGFQTAEFLQAHGCVDAVVDRQDMVPLLARLLRKAMINRS